MLLVVAAVAAVGFSVEGPESDVADLMECLHHPRCFLMVPWHRLLDCLSAFRAAVVVAVVVAVAVAIAVATAIAAIPIADMRTVSFHFVHGRQL